MRYTYTDTATDQTLFSGDLTCRQCTFVKGDGHRCQRRTCKTLPYCWQHTSSQLGVKVGPSTIPGAGSGLFATKKFDSKSRGAGSGGGSAAWGVITLSVSTLSGSARGSAA